MSKGQPADLAYLRARTARIHLTRAIDALKVAGENVPHTSHLQANDAIHKAAVKAKTALTMVKDLEAREGQRAGVGPGLGF